jgi:NAD(P)-dependent dehydrogenase (short-subunit alcohol dehydrogenase family)
MHSKRTEALGIFTRKDSIMQDKNILITGGTDGQGKATAHRLAQMGARLLLVGRNRHRGEAAVDEIIRASGNKAVALFPADLSLVREMGRVADHTRHTFDRLDVLVHGAGGWFPQKRQVTDEGLEQSLAVQYLARYVLTQELLDLLRAAPAPQVISIAGGGTVTKTLDLDDLNSEENYDGKFGAIARAGAANDMLTLEQIARYPDITFYNYGPGLVRTKTVGGPSFPVRLFFNTIGRLFTRSPQQSADDIVALITGETPHPSGFYGPSLKRTEKPAAATPQEAARLWAYGEKTVSNLTQSTGKVADNLMQSTQSAW